MSEGNLTNVFLWCYLAPRDWRCHEISTGITAIGATREEALEGFKREWGQRSPFVLIERAPKGPRPPGAPATDAPAVENITAKEREELVTEVYHRCLLLAHPDKAADGPLDRGEVTRMFTQLYEAATRR